MRPPSRLLNVMKTLKQAQIDAVICAGWVPFLKELARHCHTDHSMSLDIDLLLRARARERETIREGESIIKVHGAKTSLDLCLIDGAEDLNEHVETIQINCREGEIVETFEIAVPNAAGFLILKATVCRYREKPKDAYDIYYYCR
jgi:hypothetical protein